MARAQTQGCLCVSNPRDPRRGRQRLDHCLPDRGGEGLQGQLLDVEITGIEGERLIGTIRNSELRA